MSWFGWLTKPHLMVTGLDRLIGYSEGFIVLMLVAGTISYLNWRQTQRIRKQHGPSCTCWTCMGVSI